MLPLSVSYLLTQFLNLFSDSSSHVPPSRNRLHASPQPLRFELRQYHAVTSNAQILFHDAPQRYHAGSTRPDYRVKTRNLKSHRPSSQEAFHKARARSLETEPLRWDEEEIEAPDVESRETLLTLSKMSNNAYLDPGEPGWYDLGDTWNVVRHILKTISSFRKGNLIHPSLVLPLWLGAR